MMGSSLNWLTLSRCRHGAAWTGHVGASCNKEDDSMKTFIGIDVSLTSSAFCVLDEHGQILKERRSQVNRKPSSPFFGACPG
jgi:hypothetical protein